MLSRNAPYKTANEKKEGGPCRKKMQKNQWVLDEAKRAEKSGIPVDIDGIPYASGRPGKAYMVRQNSSYMLDYEGDERGHIVALHIDSVGSCEKSPYKSKTKK